MSDETTAKEVAQQALTTRIHHEEGFLERLISDPTATAKPVLQELLGADSPLDLSSVRVEVHFETDDVIHFVLPVESPEDDLDEVSGFQMPPPLRLGAMTAAQLNPSAVYSHGCPACPHFEVGPAFSAVVNKPKL